MNRGVSSPTSSVSGRPLHPPSRFEATREKEASRVEGGKKAAASRGLQIHDTDDEQPKIDQEDIPTTDRHGSDLLGPDFRPGKNPVRQEVSRRVARERGHEAFVEQGKKGGSTQRGIHAGQINKLDADDMSTYLEHPEVGVPEKNPNRVVGGKKAALTRGNQVHGEPNVGPNAGGNTRGNTRDQDQKDPVRVEAGKKAARTRGFHVRDDDDDEYDENEENENENQEDEDKDQGQQERGQQGGSRQSGSQQEGKNPNRVRGGKQAARTKGQHVVDDDDNNNNNNNNNDDVSEQSESGDFHHKDPNRVEAGKKAASHFDHQHFSEMGKKGAAARIEKYGLQRRSRSGENENEDENGDENESDNENDSYRDSNQGKNPHRVEGGKKAASHFSHEHFAEIGKKGAQARVEKYGQQRHDQSSGEGGSSNQQYRSSRGASQRSQQQRDQDEDENMEGEEEEDQQQGRGQGGEQRQQGKNPNRVRGGKQAARTRGNRVHDDDYENEGEDNNDANSNQNQRRRSSGSSSRRGRDSRGMNRPDDEDLSDEDYDDSRASRESIYSHAGFPLSVSSTRDDGKVAARVRGGQSAALQRGFNVERGEEEMTSKNPKRMEGGKKAASQRSHQDFVEMGRKGGRSRGQQQQGNQDEDQNMQQEEGGEDQGQGRQGGKNPNRVRGGKQAARTRGQHVADDDDDGASDLSDSGDFHRKDPVRVEAGKKAASHFDHQHFAEMGKKGAAARWGKDFGFDEGDDKDRQDYGEQSSKETGRYRSKRESDTNIQSPSKRTRHLAY